jgi:hypothetical protein
VTLRDRIPVEPLEEDRLARIERAVIAALPARPARRSPWPVLVPVAILAVFAALVFYRAQPRHEAAPPRAEEPVFVKEAPDGSRHDLGDAVITTGPGTTFSVWRPDGAVAVVLVHGRIELDVASRAGRPPLYVHADDVTVTVVGTRFTVELENGEVSVTVAEGVVSVARGEEHEQLAAGERWSRPVKYAAATPVPEREPEPEAETEAEVPEAPKKKPKKEPPVPVAADPLDDLRSAIRTAKVERPVDNYREIVKKTGPEGAQGLYGLAYHEASDKTAMRLLDSYVRRFPEGDELADVLWLRLKIYCLQAFDGKCRTAAHTFIGRFGDDERRGIADRVTYTD